MTARRSISKSHAARSPAFESHSALPVHHFVLRASMAGKTAIPPNSKRKPPRSRTSSSPNRSVSHKILPLHDPNHPDEKSQRSGSKYHKFSYPERRKPSRSENALQSSPSAHPTSSNNHYVFVYGTLKRGFPNSHLLERATCIGEFRTVTRYPLVVGGKYHSPYLLDMPTQGSRVKGEVYAVDDATLADLDHLENVGVNYTRRVTKVSSCGDRSFVADAFVYFKTNGLDELSKKEFLDDYQCRRYVPRHKRTKDYGETTVVPVVSRR